MGAATFHYCHQYGVMKPSQAFEFHRGAIRRIVTANRASNPRVFGSMVHGEDTEASDLDLLMDPLEGTTLFVFAASIGSWSR